MRASSRGFSPISPIIPSKLDRAREAAARSGRRSSSSRARYGGGRPRRPRLDCRQCAALARHRRRGRRAGRHDRRAAGAGHAGLRGGRAAVWLHGAAGAGGRPRAYRRGPAALPAVFTDWRTADCAGARILHAQESRLFLPSWAVVLHSLSAQLMAIAAGSPVGSSFALNRAIFPLIAASAMI